jgi:hypothetical protein
MHRADGVIPVYAPAFEQLLAGAEPQECGSERDRRHLAKKPDDRHPPEHTPQTRHDVPVYTLNLKSKTSPSATT